MCPVPLLFVADIPHIFMTGLDAQQAVVFAQLGIRGKSYGVHGILVPLRNEVPPGSDPSALPRLHLCCCNAVGCCVQVLRPTSHRSVPGHDVIPKCAGARSGRQNGREWSRKWCEPCMCRKAELCCAAVRALHPNVLMLWCSQNLV